MFPKKKPGIDVMIAVGKPKGGPPPLDTPGKKPMMSMRNDAQETPEDEQQEDAGVIKPRPEAVGYHTEAENCGACEYMKGDQCSFLKMPVSAGDHCSQFEAKAQDEEVEHDAGGQDFEGSGDSDQEYGR